MIVPSLRRTTVPPDDAMPTTLVALAGILVMEPAPHETTLPSVRAAKLAAELPATANAFVKSGGGNDSFDAFLPHAATVPNVSLASALIVAPAALLRSEERRVGKVTGVQTCALPIYSSNLEAAMIRSMRFCPTRPRCRT